MVAALERVAHLVRLGEAGAAEDEDAQLVLRPGIRGEGLAGVAPNAGAPKAAAAWRKSRRFMMIGGSGTDVHDGRAGAAIGCTVRATAR